MYFPLCPYRGQPGGPCNTRRNSFGAPQPSSLVERATLARTSESQLAQRTLFPSNRLMETPYANNNVRIKAEDFALAERVLIRLDQMDDADEFQHFKTVLGDDGILRLKTRLEMTFSFGKADHWDRHQKRHHLGVDTTLTEFLSEFWMPSARLHVKRALRDCLLCRRMNAQQFALPTMPPLPGERVRRHAPFQSIGIDFLGPTTISLAGEKIKAWILIITCLATRAVYLEATLDLTSETFINVLRRFISRRGKPDIIWSDNATTFKLAQKTLELLSAPGPDQEVQNFLTHNRIQWRFIAQISPWAGGFYERLVKLVKDCFKRTLGRRILSFDQLNTFVAEVEATLNYRPITAVSDAVDGPVPLRPINLLQPEIHINWETTTDPIDSEEQISSTHERLASRIQALREANDWDHKGPRLQNFGEPKEGMVVLISQDLVPRNQWPMGRIVETHGRPGAIRSVKVEIPVRGTINKKPKDMPRKTVLTRPVNRIFPLEAGPEMTNQGTEAVPAIEQPNENQPELAREPGHQMVTRRKAKLLEMLPVVAMVILTLALPFASGFPIGKCEECGLTCYTKGIVVTVPPEIQKFEICCAESCIVRQGIKALNFELPIEVLLNNHQCEARFWTDSQHTFTSNTTCPAVDECDLIDCYFCFTQLVNPTCQPVVAAMLAEGLSLSLLCFIFTMCSMVGYAMAGLKILFWIFSVLFARLFKPRKETWVLSEEEENLLYPHRRIRRPRPATRNWASGRVSQMTMLVMAFLPFVHGGIETVAIMAKSESCLNNGTTKMCQVKGSVTLALLPAGQPNVLSIKTDDGLILGTLQPANDVRLLAHVSETFVQRSGPPQQCHTDIGQTLADIQCEDGPHFTSKCGPNMTDHTVVLPFQHAEISTACHVMCLAGRTKFSLVGQLHYIPLRQQSEFGARVSESLEEASNSGWADFSFDWASTFHAFVGLKTGLIFFIVLMIGLAIIIFVVHFSPVYRLWRTFSWLLVNQAQRPNNATTFSVAAILLLAAGGSFGWKPRKGDSFPVLCGELRIPDPEFSLGEVEGNTVPLHQKIDYRNRSPKIDIKEGNLKQFSFLRYHQAPNNNQRLGKTMPIPFRERPPFFSAPTISRPTNEVVINDRLVIDIIGQYEAENGQRANNAPPPGAEDQRGPWWFDQDWGPQLPMVPENRGQNRQMDDQRDDWGAHAPPGREPSPHEHTERLSLWMERRHGQQWYQTATIRREAEENLRRELRTGGTLFAAHLGPFANVRFDGFSRYGPANTQMFPGRNVREHFRRRGFQVDPNLPCLQEYGGYSNSQQGIHVDYFPIDMVNVRSQSREDQREAEPPRPPRIRAYLALEEAPNDVQEGPNRGPPARRFLEAIGLRRGNESVGERAANNGRQAPLQRGERAMDNGRPNSPDGSFENRPRRAVPNRPMRRWQNGLFIVALALCLGNLAEGKEFPSPRTCHQPLEAADMACRDLPCPTSFHTPTMPKPIKMPSSSSSAYSSSSSSSLSSSPDRQSPPPPRKKAVELFNIAAATPEREAKSGRKFSVRDFIDAEAKEEPSSKRLPTCSACQLSGHRRGAKACPLYVAPQRERTAAASRPGTSNTRRDSPEEGEIIADKADRSRPPVRAPSKGWNAAPSISPPRKAGDANKQRGRSRTLRHFPLDPILKSMGPIIAMKKIPAQDEAGIVADAQPPKVAVDLVAIHGELSALRASVAYLTTEQARLAQFIRHHLAPPPNMTGGNSEPCGSRRRHHRPPNPPNSDDERRTKKRSKHHRSPSPDAERNPKKERRHHREVR
ncbi:hypothetical protein niasHS_016626 [Heterodera schachtii]|uniref:Integrase catalytic domain-containing protein n=1 Tax=Heterodera schachtii TaxID=97005 RepID=A0ABD2I863_HETSC